MFSTGRITAITAPAPRLNGTLNICMLFTFCLAVCAAAAPLHRRQTGDLDCNLARLKIISDIAAAQPLISQINTTDLVTASAVAMAQTGLMSTNAAIQDILTAVFANQTAPANSGDQVGLGVNGAHNALSTITDPSVNATVAAAQAKLLTIAGREQGRFGM
ncbi:hypothetical protein C8F04DRAFT_1235208 [Mycena alexandri]|uniref:Uncharacterized protein n=1 Tax=Mycena alexandri TaxID=1745969 RepID=A0AAD6X2V8_9AGAR|nr:hypothetical protein C8F04DRAFT_1235208 [Mycena alexandri]